MTGLSSSQCLELGEKTTRVDALSHTSNRETTHLRACPQPTTAPDTSSKQMGNTSIFRRVRSGSSGIPTTPSFPHWKSISTKPRSASSGDPCWNSSTARLHSWTGETARVWSAETLADEEKPTEYTLFDDIIPRVVEDQTDDERALISGLEDPFTKAERAERHEREKHYCKIWLGRSRM